MPVKTINIGLTHVSATQECPLGMEYEQDAGADGNGPKVWIYVQNGDAASLVVGTVCVRKTAATTKVVELSSQAAPENASKVVGVAQHTIPTLNYGFIQKRGRGLVLADTGGITVDFVLVVGNAVNGRADSIVETTVTTVGFGTVLATAAATATGFCHLDCRG